MLISLAWSSAYFSHLSLTPWLSPTLTLDQYIQPSSQPCPHLAPRFSVPGSGILGLLQPSPGSITVILKAVLHPSVWLSHSVGNPLALRGSFHLHRIAWSSHPHLLPHSCRSLLTYFYACPTGPSHYSNMGAREIFFIDEVKLYQFLCSDLPILFREIPN